VEVRLLNAHELLIAGTEGEPDSVHDCRLACVVFADESRETGVERKCERVLSFSKNPEVLDNQLGKKHDRPWSLSVSVSVKVLDNE
jgi:hypothetical protein